MQEKISVFRDSLISKHKAEVESVKEKILGKYKKESKQIVLDVKSKLISQVCENALENILTLDKKDKEKIIKSLIGKAKDLIEYDEVLTSKDMEKFVKSEIKKEAKVTASDINGLIFLSNGGKVKVDMTFETLFREVFDENEEKLQEVLFRK